MTIEQIDITTAYLNGDLEENVLMEPPKNLEDRLEFIIGSRKSEKRIKDTARSMLNRLSEGDVVCRLKKALYGLRQAGRAWHARLDNELRKMGLSHPQQIRASTACRSRTYERS